MLEIKHDMSYLTNREGLKKMGFTDITVFKICFQGRYSDDTKYMIKELKDYLEEHYKMYQYLKDNGIKFGQEELFYWSDGGERYFDVTLKDNNSIEHNERVAKEIEQYVKDNYSEQDLYIRYQYTDRINWEKVNNYIKNFELDLNNIPFDELRAVSAYIYSYSKDYAEGNIKKLYKIENQIMEHYKDKKIVYNGIKGTLKQFGDGSFGVFKPRATKTYYPISLEKIREFKIA